MERWLRRLTGAMVLGTLLVLVIDSLLHLALGLVRDDPMDAPWWINARIAERSAWVIAALLTWWAAPMLASVSNLRDAAPPLRREHASRIVGTWMIAIPILWFAASWVVFAVRATLQGAWKTEAARLLEPYVYSTVVLTNAPWLLAGATLMVLARHLPSD